MDTVLCEENGAVRLITNLILIVTILVPSLGLAGAKIRVGWELSDWWYGTPSPNQGLNHSYSQHSYIDNIPPRSGNNVGAYSGGVGNSNALHSSTAFALSVPASPLYMSVWLYHPSTGDSVKPAIRIINFRGSPGHEDSSANIWLDMYKWGIGTRKAIHFTSTATVPENVWSLMQIYIRYGITNDTLRVTYNGETLTDVNPMSTGTIVEIDMGFNEDADQTNNCYLGMDDLQVNDTTGIYENGMPDSTARIVLLPMVADSARTDWLAAAGGTTNLWKGLKNVPPIGAGKNGAGEVDTTSIKNTTSDTSNYYTGYAMDYTTAGIPSDKTIRLVFGVVRHGEHAASGTELGRFTLYSNPTDSGETQFTFGEDAGAHGIDWSTTVDGNGVPTPPSPQRWRTTYGYWMYFPTVARGTQPKLKIRRYTLNTNQIEVDLAGAMVVYGAAQEGSIQMQSDIQFWGYMQKRIPFIKSEIFCTMLK
jgi:hypothetical protein